MSYFLCFFFFSSRRRHTRLTCDWSSDVCSSDERERDEVAPEPEGELEVLEILASQRGDRDRNAGQVDALVRADRPTDDDTAARASRADLFDLQADQPIV